MSSPRIGFIGFGEAGSHLAQGLQGAGIPGFRAFDIHSGAPGVGQAMRRRAGETETVLVDSPADLLAGSDILLSTVTADNAVEAALQSAPHLEPRHVYADMNSVAPATKRRIAAIVAERSAAFVEVAIMGPVPPSLHRVPILLAGDAAHDFRDRFSPYGMSMEVISDRIGAAAAVKLSRSIIVKGLEALMLECALASSEFEADTRVFESLEQSFPGIDWQRLAGYMISRVVVHGARRAREMDEAAEMLSSLGIEPMMTRAAARRQDWCAELGIKDVLDPEAVGDYRSVVEAIRRLRRGS